MPQFRVQDIAEHLKKVRESEGSEAYQESLEALARQVLSGGQGEVFMTELIQLLQDDSFDLEKFKQEVPKPQQGASPEDQQEIFLKALQLQIPNLKTQAHFDVVTATFEALQVTLNAYFGGDTTSALKARGALNKALDLASQVPGIEASLEEMPEDQRPADFVAPPKEYGQAEIAERLLGDIDVVESSERLHQWYAANRPDLDRIVDQGLRNKVFDAIRAKRTALSN